MTIETTAVQALHGTPLTTNASVSCDDCATDLEAGDAITVQAREGWTPTAVFCPACTPDTTDDRTATVDGRLTTTIDPQTGERVLTFAAADYDLEDLPLDTTEPRTDPPATADHGPDTAEDENEEGDPYAEPTADPILEPDHVLVPFRSNRADRVFHFDNGEGAPCCEFTGEYEAVPIEEASDYAPRACRACKREQRGRWETRPCPHCNEPIALTRWPMHVRDCSGPTQATDSDPATDPNPKTETDRNAPTDDRLEHHARSERTAGPDPELRVVRIDYETDRERPTTIDRHHRSTSIGTHLSSAPPALIATLHVAIPPTETPASTQKMSSNSHSGFHPWVKTGYAKLGTQQRRKGKDPVHSSLFGHWSKSYRPPAEAVAIRSRDWTRSIRGPRSPPTSRSIGRPVVWRVAVRQRPTGQTMHTPSSGIRPRPPPMSPGFCQRHTCRPETAPEHGQRAHSTGFDSVGRPGRPRYDPRRESIRKDVFELAGASVLKDVFETSAGSEPLLAARFRRVAYRTPAIAARRDLHTQ